VRIPDVRLPKLIRPAEGFAFFLGLGSALLLMLHVFTPPGALEHWDAVKAAAADHGLNPRLVASVVEAASGGRTGARSPNGRRGLMAAGSGAAPGGAEAELAAGCGALQSAAKKLGPHEPVLVLLGMYEDPETVAEWGQTLPQLSAEEIVARCAMPETRAFIDRVNAAWERFEPDTYVR